MLKLDKNRPYAVLFDGDRQMQFHYQDGRMFDMSTDNEVDLLSIAVKAKPAITCRFCNAKRETAEMMHEHLIAKHGAQVAKAKAGPEKAEEPTKPEPPEEKPETGTAKEKDGPEAEAKVETEGKVETEPEAETVSDPVNPETPEEKIGPKKKADKSKKSATDFQRHKK